MRLYRKSHNTASLLCYQGHILMENRTGLVVSAVVSHADGTRERTTARAMLDTVPGRHPKTVGADKAYDTADFITACRARHVTPHVAQNDGLRGGSAIDGRTTRHEGYRLSQTIRKRIAEHFGRDKTVGRIRQTVFRGFRRVDRHFKLTMTASNLMRRARTLFAVPLGAPKCPRQKPPRPLPLTCAAPLNPQQDGEFGTAMLRPGPLGQYEARDHANFNSPLMVEHLGSKVAGVG